MILPGTRRALILAAMATLSAVHVAVAQQTSVDSAVRNIFGRRGTGGVPFGPAQWNESGDSYSTLEPTADGGVDIVEYDAASGARTVRVAARLLKPKGANAPIDIEEYTWSADGKRLLVFTNTQKVWRQNTRGDYWVLDVPSGTLHQVAAGSPDATLMFAKFSPDGQRVAYVRAGEIYVEPAMGGKATRLTHDASRTRVNGMTDWVYEEEFDLRDAFRWSPDSKSILFWQFDMSGIRDYLLINDTDSLYPFTVPVQYPKAGTTNSAVRLGVLRADGTGTVTWVRLEGDPRNHYIPRAEWAANSSEVIVQYMDRPQHRDMVHLVDAKSGAARMILDERDSAWVDVVDEIKWVDAGQDFIWVSEAGGWIYFSASPENATQRYLYRASMKSPGPPQRVSPAAVPGTHGYDISPNAKWAFHNYSRTDQPTTIDLVALPGHTVVRPLGRASNPTTPVTAAELFHVTVPDGATLDGWMLKPRDFDATKKYPVLVHVYGEPAAQTVLDAWGGAQQQWHQMLADRGYVVISVDPRGTPGPKGRDWRKVIYGAIGPISSREIADAARGLTRTRTYLDSTRVGIWGWSGGGSSTLNAMFRYPDVFSVGMAVAPVADQRLYDTIYEERYVGLPQDNPKGYEIGSPITFADGLKGKLLILHGEGDDNVHYQGTERLVNRLVELGKAFDMMVYPNRTHCICEGPGTTLHVYSLLSRYLLTNLPAGGR
jgi:dipeptidyl-peptidase-4